MPATPVPPHVPEDDPADPRDPLGRLRGSSALRMDRPEPGGLSQAAQDPAPLPHLPDTDRRRRGHHGRQGPGARPARVVHVAGRGDGAWRGELCGLQWADIDLDTGLVHIAFSYLVLDDQKIRKDTKAHQDRYLAIDAITAAV